MRSILFKIFTFTFLIQVILITQLLAQIDKEYPSKIKKRYFMGVYNHKSAAELKMVLSVKAAGLNLINEYIKSQIEDSLNFHLTNKSKNNKNWYLNFTNGMKWELPDGLTKSPDIYKRYNSKDDSFLEEPEVLNWVFYMQVLDYWKKNKKLPYKVIHSFSYIDTLEFDNNTNFRFQHERQYDQDSLIRVNTELIPLN